MDRTSLSKIYEIISFLLLFGAIAVFFAIRNTHFVLILLAFAIFFRMMTERSSRIAVEKENQKLKDDLRRLTHILEYSKKEEEE
jgi:predicted membrane protein